MREGTPRAESCLTVLRFEPGGGQPSRLERGTRSCRVPRRRMLALASTQASGDSIHRLEAYLAARDALQHHHPNVVLRTKKRRMPPGGLEHGLRAGKVLDAPQQALQNAEPRAGRIPRHHVTRQRNLVKGQAALLAPDAHAAAAADDAAAGDVVARDEERRGRVLVEPLGSPPGGVLQRKERPVGGQQEIERAGPDDDVARLGHDSGEGAVEGRARRGVPVGEDAPAAELPVDAGGVYGPLHVGSLKVRLRGGRRGFSAGVGVAQRLVRLRARV